MKINRKAIYALNSLDYELVRQYVNENIDTFHTDRLRCLSDLTLQKMAQKNPYLPRAKNVATASEFVRGAMDAFLSSSEEKIFGDFLEGLAIFVCKETMGGHKSSSPGLDLEF